MKADRPQLPLQALKIVAAAAAALSAVAARVYVTTKIWSTESSRSSRRRRNKLVIVYVLPVPALASITMLPESDRAATSSGFTNRSAG